MTTDAAVPKITGKSFEAETIWTRSQNYRSSARLHLQHWLFQGTLGFVLHPQVLDSLRTKTGTIRVADLGCGNAAWLVELSRALTSTTKARVELIGYDIQPQFFPAQDFLPSNVTLKVHDILSEPPLDAIEGFDLVHVRAFASIIKDNDISPLVTSVMKMLKPGGWMQWDETPMTSMVGMASAQQGSTGTQGISTLLHVLKEGGKANGTPWDWLETLNTDIEKQGLLDVSVTSYALRPDQYQAWTEDYLMVYEGIADMLPSKDAAPNAPMTKEVYQALFARVLEDTSKGAVMHSQKVNVAIGRKGQ